MSEKKKLLISFSGGRTSAYMMWWLYNEWKDRDNWEMVTVFANTGKEVEGTLFFVDECSQEWGIPIVWVEAKCKDKNGVPFSEKGWSVKHKIITYETASRKGEPFEEMISILGIPCQTAPFCSPQLKREPIKSFAKSIGWEDFYTAIGVRFDEQNRVNDNWISNKIMYPLIFNNPTTKRQVKEWWDKQSFDLNIHPDEGNCDNCWKKDFPRLARNMVRVPKTFDWWEEMINVYGGFNPRQEDNPSYTFFRGGKSVMDIREMAKMSQAQLKQLTMFDQIDSCSESCEVF